MSNARVFLFEPPTSDTIDVGPAAQYGDIQYLFRPTRGEKSRSSIWETDKLAEETLDALMANDYDSGRDYICISGHQISIAILIATVATEYGRFNALFFDTRERSYVARQLGMEFEDDRISA